MADNTATLAPPMTSPLFRAEVLASKQESWLGNPQLVQPISVRLAVLVACCFAVVVSAYSVVGLYTRRVHATGVMAPKSGLIMIASPSAGRIVSSAASEGEKVEKGHLLYTIDVDAISSSGPTEKNVLVQLWAQTVSVEKQRASRLSIAGVEKKELRAQLDNTVSQRDQMATEVGLQKGLTLSLKERADQLRVAASRGVALTSEFQNQNYLYIQANAQLAQFEQGGLQLASRISELNAKLFEFDANLSRELAEMDRQIAQLKQQIAESEARHAIEVRAPEQGLLTSLRVHVGQQVAAGGTLLTLLPSVGNLQANLYVDSSAIGFLRKGEPVMLRYAAFPFQRFGLYRGTVSEVTRAPVDSSEPQLGMPAQSLEGRYKGIYRIMVRPDAESVIVYGQPRSLEAGMQVEADISLEKRPLYRWLLDPIYHLRRSAQLVVGD